MKPNTPASQHEECRELLPWFVNQTLDAAEHGAVLEHLETCSVCLEEVEELRDLQAIILTRSGSESEAYTETEPFHFAQVDDTTTPDARFPMKAASSWRSTPAAVRWLVAAQVASLLLLAVLLSRSLSTDSRPPLPAERFTVLSSPQQEVGSAQRFTVVFTPDASEPEIRDLLLSVGAEIVGGPSAVGAYALQISAKASSEASKEVLAQLRSNPLTQLVEPQTPRAPPAAGTPRSADR